MKTSLVEACLAIKGDIRIIGAGSIVEFSKVGSKIVVEKDFKEDLKVALLSNGWLDGDAERRVGGIQFDTEKGLREGGGEWFKVLKAEWSKKYLRCGF
jgi:hypothetical protein